MNNNNRVLHIMRRVPLRPNVLPNDSQNDEQVSVNQKSDEASSSESQSSQIVVVDLNRKKIDIPLKAIKCPKPLQRNENVDKAERFRRPCLEDVTFYERPNEPFNFDKNDAYSSLQNLIVEQLTMLDEPETSSQTEYATIGPSGCLKYLQKREHGGITDEETSEQLDEVNSKFLSSANSMIMLAERTNSEPGEISKMLDNNFNNTPRSSESFMFTVPQVKYYIEVKNDEPCVLVPFNPEDCKEKVAGFTDAKKWVESVEIEVRFSTIQKIPSTANIYLKNVNDMEKTKLVCQAHSMSAENVGVQEDLLLIGNIPKFVCDDEYLQWFMERILSANNIEMELAYFISGPFIRNPNDVWNKSRFNDDRILFARNLVEQDRDLGLRERDDEIYNKQLDELAIDEASHPFKIREKPSPNYAERSLVATYNKDKLENGLIVANHFFSKRHSSNNMRLNACCPSTRIVPRYRKMFQLSREVRIASDKFITELDKKMRERFFILEQSSRDEFNRNRLDGCYLRIVDDYDEESNFGFIGIEGWPERSVDLLFASLKSFFVPNEIIITDKHEKFLFGLGECLLKYLIQQMKETVIVDIDQFQSKFFVFSEKVENFENTLNEYSTDSLNVKARMPLFSPYVNDMTRNILTVPILNEMGKLLSSNIIVDEKTEIIDFDGPYDSFDLFYNIITEVNQKIFERYSINLPTVIRDQTCPICLSQIATNNFRLDNCGHVYCRDCLNQQVLSAFRDFDSMLKCYYENCNKTICAMDVKEIVIGNQDRIKILDSQKLRKMFGQIASSVVQTQKLNIKFCSTPDCPGLLEAVDKEQTTVECSVCQRIYCGGCMERPHPNISCEELNQGSSSDDMSLKLYTARMGPNMVKNCPKCNAIIEKDDGCEHMMCTLCGIHFCWICGYQANLASKIYFHEMSKHR